jgi:putative transposase
VIRFHPSPFLHSHWIGIDLNTTGHAVVAADLFSGRVLKLGKKLPHARTATTKNCTKLYKEGKLWKLKKMKTREKKEFRTSLHKIARQIVSFADSACAGIKFEKLFSFHYHYSHETEDSYEFSFENGSFVSLLHLVEKRALNRGIPVLYVNPANTSKRCSRCGSIGRRVRKRFECPQCRSVIHADVNAAFNIAATPCASDKAEIHRMRTLRKKMRKLARAQRILSENLIHAGPEPSSNEELGDWLDHTSVIPGEA